MKCRAALPGSADEHRLDRRVQAQVVVRELGEEPLGGAEEQGAGSIKSSISKSRGGVGCPVDRPPAPRFAPGRHARQGSGRWVPSTNS